MKPFLSLLLIFWVTILQAKNYYVSASGNDLNDGLSTSTPWRTISKVNSFTFAANDVILFNRGDEFYGSIIVSRSNLFFDSYGTGALPLITGFTTTGGWVDKGGGIWSANVPAAKADLLTVAINNSLQRIGRYPNYDASNSGWLTYESINSGTPSITDNQLSASPNWTGAVAVIRKWHWVIDTCRIKSHSGGTLSYSNPTSHTGNTGYGYFIQDDIRTLDQFGEWFLNKSTKELSIYFGANNPLTYTTKVSTVDILFNCGGGVSGYTARSNISVQNIAFEGANKFAIYAFNSTGISVKNCTVNNVNHGIFLWNVNTSLTDGNTVTHTLSTPIFQQGVSSPSTTIINNTLRNCGLFAGMGQSGDGANVGIDISSDQGTICQYNRLDSIAYHGIAFQGNNILIKNNYITNFCMVQDDGGGIYSYADRTKTNRIVEENIVVGGIGNVFGTDGHTENAHCIYFDGGSKHIKLINNTLSVTSGAAIFLNEVNDIRMTGNTIYNVPKGIMMQRFPNATLLRNDTVTSNIIHANESNLFYWNGSLNSPTTVDIQTDVRAVFGRLDSNYYRTDATKPFHYWYHLTAYGTFFDGTPMSFASWKSFIGKENNSQLINTSAKIFEYNPSKMPLTLNFAGLSKKDVFGTVYNNSVIIPPFGSIILLDNGLSQAVNNKPSANAGSNQTITLPINTAGLEGIGTDTDGTITNYLWTKIAGPAGSFFSNSNAAATTVNSLVQGNYFFELTVTDNAGATAKDTLQVTVSGLAVNAPFGGAAWPIPGKIEAEDFDNGGPAVAYNDLTAGNEGNAYRLNESTDIEIASEGGYNIGFVDAGEWTEYTVNVLNAGTYTFSTRVASNNSTSSFRVEMDGVTVATVAVPNTGGYQMWQTVTIPGITMTAGLKTLRLYFVSAGANINYITFNLPSNQLPLANAGNDMDITLPNNTANLSGSGTDADGTITSYEWVKIGGPSSGSITTPNNAATSVSGLIQGVYQYELTVTDNNGEKGKDTVQVTVNGAVAVNQVPVAFAGNNQIITLPANSTSLTGTGLDTDGTISNFSWAKISGPSGGTIVTPNAATTLVSGLLQGVYQYELTVTDNNGATGRDTLTVQVTVNVIVVTNQAPVANAGTDKIVNLPVNSVTLIGSGTDADGAISNYAWVKIGGPAGGMIGAPNNTTTTISGLAQGVYKYELTVTDNAGAAGKDTVQITVIAIANNWPVANAGADKIITLPVNAVVLTGSGTDSDGTIAGYTWTKISGPAMGSIDTPGASSTNVSSLSKGTYQYELTVVDNGGATGKDTVQVLVNKAVNNQSPKANAGNNKTVVLPVNYVSLSGDAIDLDGAVISYEWAKISGPSLGGGITKTNVASVNITNLVQGLYQYELTVTDDSGDVGKDTVDVTVNSAITINRLPNVNAGNDINIVLPLNTVSLKGAATDSDGTIAAYKWRTVSGPAGYIFETPNLMDTKLNNLFQGVYEIELEVADNAGGKAKDTLKVTVSGQRVSAIISNELKIYPNPFKDVVNLSITTVNKNSKIWISVTDMKGAMIKNNELVTQDNTTLYKLNLSNLNNGNYIITLRFDDGQIVSSKVIKYSGQ